MNFNPVQQYVIEREIQSQLNYDIQRKAKDITMNNLNVIVFDIDEVRKGLVDYHVDLLKDESYTRDMLQNDKIHFDFKNMSEDELCQTYAELDVGREVFKHIEGDRLVYENPNNGDMTWLGERQIEKTPGLNSKTS